MIMEKQNIIFAIRAELQKQTPPISQAALARKIFTEAKHPDQAIIAWCRSNTGRFLRLKKIAQELGVTIDSLVSQIN